MSKNYTKSVSWVQRFFLTPELLLISNPYDILINKSKTSHNLTIIPNAWMRYFQITDAEQQKYINATIQEQVRGTEAELRKTRVGIPSDENPRKTQTIDQPYTPTKYSRRMWCICCDVKLRIAFINFIKELLREGKETLRAWRSGDRSASYPVGLAPPSFPRLVNLLPLRQEAFT